MVDFQPGILLIDANQFMDTVHVWDGVNLSCRPLEAAIQGLDCGSPILVGTGRRSENIEQISSIKSRLLSPWTSASTLTRALRVSSVQFRQDSLCCAYSCTLDFVRTRSAYKLDRLSLCLL